ncbi:MAG: hypothetical protein ACFB6S_12355 [Geminicoccaceae bacterium]
METPWVSGEGRAALAKPVDLMLRFDALFNPDYCVEEIGLSEWRSEMMEPGRTAR